MQLALVVGTATSTVKHRSMNGWRLMVVQPLLADGKSPDGDPVLAIDALGVGRGETVIASNDGISARAMVKDEQTPVRWTVIGTADPPTNR
jgi:microcompartment protein CcmK/EutM